MEIEKDLESGLLIDRDSDISFADNRVSRALAVASYIFIPKWCSTPGHWSIKFLDYFWTDCGCCLFYRGVVVGCAIMASSLALLSALLYVLI
jgi:hypothetical protein